MSKFTSSSRQDYGTPPEWIARIRDFFGGRIHLDPCASWEERLHFAESNIMEAGDGLSADWGQYVPQGGSVFMNSPFGRDVGKWCLKMQDEYRKRQDVHYIALTPARVSSHWFQDLEPRATLFIRGRVTFIDPTTRAPVACSKGKPAPATFPVALSYWGPDWEHFLAFWEPYGVALWGWGYVGGRS